MSSSLYMIDADCFSLVYYVCIFIWPSLDGVTDSFTILIRASSLLANSPYNWSFTFFWGRGSGSNTTGSVKFSVTCYLISEPVANMSSSRTSPSQHGDTLWALTNGPRAPLAERIRDTSRARATRRYTSPGVMTGNYNRPSMQVFADFQYFQSPRNSRSRLRYNEETKIYDDEPRSPTEEGSSSAFSPYNLEKQLPDPPYHIFTLAKKKQLVYIVSLGGLFSPLSSNIYFPALGQISRVSNLQWLSCLCRF